MSASSSPVVRVRARSFRQFAGWSVQLQTSVWILDASLAITLGLVAGLIRWVGMTRQSLWIDEMGSLGLAYEQLGTFFQHIYTEGAHPPLYFLTVHLLNQQLGLDPIPALRVPSVLAGAASVSVVYGLGRLLVGRIAGTIAALITLLSPFAVWYSREGRMYSMLWFLLLCSFLFLVISLQSRRRVWLMPYSAFLALALYTDYSAVMALVPQGALIAWLFVRQRQGRRFLAWVAGAYVTGWLLFLPWLAVLSHQLPTLRGQSFAAYPPGLTTVVHVLLDQLNLWADYASLGRLVPRAVFWAVLAAYVATIILAIRYWRAGWARVSLSLTLGPVAVWLLFIAAGNKAVLAPRVVGILAFGLALLAGSGVQVAWERLRRTIPSAAPLGLAAGLLLVASNAMALVNVEAAGTNGARWPEVAQDIAEQTTEADALIYYPYGLKFVVDAYLPAEAPARATGVGSWAGANEPIQRQFERWAKDHDRVFLVFAAADGIDVPLHDLMFQRDGYRRVSGDPTAPMGVLEYVPVS
jgi:4-amino-4-deoxy-L-arabinose transferase-like glycosyltransferase